MVALLCVLLASCDGGDNNSKPTPTSEPTSPSPTASQPAPTATPTPLPASDTPPTRDLADLARRFLGVPAGAPLVARDEPFGYEIGDSETFHLLDLEGPSPYDVTATVEAISDHAYFFVENGRSYSQAALNQIVDDFESKVWPTVTGAFGEPKTPGVDADPRITILNAGLRGAGGYVSGADQFPAEIAPRSNEREMLYIDAENLSVPGVPYNGLVAHELQHLVHENYDDGEEAWVNEGLSQVASELLGDGDEWIYTFLNQPDLQLDAWPTDGDVIPHYAASELFFAYLLDQYGGRENAEALIGEPGDGIDGVEEYLTGFDTTFDPVFADWIAANWLDADSGPYSHPTLDERTSVSTTVSGDGEGTVHQYAADYLQVAGGTFSFDGVDEVSIGVPELDGAFWWSNRGDAIDSRLTRTLDLSDVDTATLHFQTWYDIEEDWDYAYVAASTDGGETWTALPGEHTTTNDPTSQSYGPGYTGESGGWVDETVDLSAYAGSEVMIRFEYITDDAANAVGFAVDNIKVPEIGFTDEGTDTGWARKGFRSVDGPLPQHFRALLIHGNGTVSSQDLASGNKFTILAQGPLTIAIIATTRSTTEPAAYTWTFSQ